MPRTCTAAGYAGWALRAAAPTAVGWSAWNRAPRPGRHVGHQPDDCARDWRVGDLDVALRTKVGVRGHPGVDERAARPWRGAAPGAAGPPTLTTVACARSTSPARRRPCRLGGRGRAWTPTGPSRSTSAAAIAAARATLADAGGSPRGLAAALPWEVAGPLRLRSSGGRPPIGASGAWRRSSRRWPPRLAAGGTGLLAAAQGRGGQARPRGGRRRFAAVDVGRPRGAVGGWRSCAGRVPGAPQVDPLGRLRAAPRRRPARGVVGTFAAEKVDPGTRACCCARWPSRRRVGRARPRPGAVARPRLRHGPARRARRWRPVRARWWPSTTTSRPCVGAAANLGADDRGRASCTPTLTAGRWRARASTRCGATRRSTSVGRWWGRCRARSSRRRTRRCAPAARPGSSRTARCPTRRSSPGGRRWGDATPAGERTFKVLWARRAGLTGGPALDHVPGRRCASASTRPRRADEALEHGPARGFGALRRHDADRRPGTRQEGRVGAGGAQRGAGLAQTGHERLRGTARAGRPPTRCAAGRARRGLLPAPRAPPARRCGSHPRACTVAGSAARASAVGSSKSGTPNSSRHPGGTASTDVA